MGATLASEPGAGLASGSGVESREKPGGGAATSALGEPCDGAFLALGADTGVGAGGVTVSLLPRGASSNSPSGMTRGPDGFVTGAGATAGAVGRGGALDTDGVVGAAGVAGAEGSVGAGGGTLPMLVAGASPGLGTPG